MHCHGRQFPLSAGINSTAGVRWGILERRCGNFGAGESSPYAEIGLKCALHFCRWRGAFFLLADLISFITSMLRRARHVNGDSKQKGEGENHPGRGKSSRVMVPNEWRGAKVAQK